MPKLGLGFGLPTTRVFAAGFSPLDIANLKLWVSADYGVTTGNVDYVDSIEIYDAGEATSNGEYFRASGGTTQFTDYNTSNYIYREDEAWQLFDFSFGDITYANNELDPRDGVWYEVNGQADPPSANYGTQTETNVILSVADRSTNGNNLSISSGFPRISVTKINGKDAFDFTSGAKFSGNNIVDAKTIYAVIRPNQTLSSYKCIIECSGGGLYSAVQGSYWGSYWSTETSSLNTVNANTSAIIGMIRRSGTDTTFRRDGATVRSGNLGGVSVSRTQLHFGNDESDSQPAHAVIAEVIAYSDGITNEQAGQVEAYLNAKYAIF